jgi:Fe-S-cluster-containing dehydrogenase component
MKPDNISVTPEKCVGCLRCQLLCSQEYQGEFNPLRAWITIERGGGGFEYRIGFTEDCTSCGICAENCVFEALSLV